MTEESLKRWTGFDVNWKLHWLEKVLSSAEICYGDKSKQLKDAKKEYWKFYNEIFLEASDVEKMLDDEIKNVEFGRGLNFSETFGDGAKWILLEIKQKLLGEKR